MACSLWRCQMELCLSGIHPQEKVPISGLIDLPFPNSVFEFGIVGFGYDPVNEDHKF